MRLLFAVLLTFLIAPTCLEAQNFSEEKLRSFTQNWLERKMKKAEMIRANLPQAPRPTARPIPPVKSSLEGNVSQNETVESEIAAAINPLDPNKVVVCAMRTTSSQLVDELAFPIFYSSDFGETWSVSEFQPETVLPSGALTASAGGGDPILAYDATGKLHLTWLRVALQLVPTGIQFMMYHAISEDDGATWTVDAEPVASGDASISLEGRVIDKEWMVSDNNPASPHFGNLYLVYVELNAVSQDSVLYQMISHTWTEAEGWTDAQVAVSSDQLPFCQFVHPAITPNGDLHLSMAGASADDGYTGIYHTVSSDGGQSFAQPNLISYFNLSCFLSEPGSEACITGILPERSYPAPALYSHPSNGELYSVWHADGFQEAVTEGVDVYFSRSTDNGLSWSTPQVVNQDEDPATDNFMPTGVVDSDGRFFLTWYDQRDNEAGDTSKMTTDYFWARYDPETDSFTDESLVSSLSTDFTTVGDVNAGFGVGEYNTTLSGGGYLLPFWSDGRTNNGALEIFMAKVDFGLATSVHSLSTQNFRLEIYPNPVREIAQLKVVAEVDLDGIQGDLLDANGRWLSNFSFPNGLPSGEHNLSLPTRSLPAGTYYLRFRAEGEGIAIRRLIKQ